LALKGRFFRFALALLLVVSFGCIAVHIFLLEETPSLEGACPFCHWLGTLDVGPAPLLLGQDAACVEQQCFAAEQIVLRQASRGSWRTRSPPVA
jgi:hypothetical protein